MISKNELIQQLRARRRSVEAEIKRVQAEAPANDIRAASNSGYLTALKVEQAFLAGILTQSEKHQRRDWLSNLIADVRKESQPGS